MTRREHLREVPIAIIFPAPQDDLPRYLESPSNPLGHAISVSFNIEIDFKPFLTSQLDGSIEDRLERRSGNQDQSREAVRLPFIPAIGFFPQNLLKAPELLDARVSCRFEQRPMKVIVGNLVSQCEVVAVETMVGMNGLIHVQGSAIRGQVPVYLDGCQQMLNWNDVNPEFYIDDVLDPDRDTTGRPVSVQEFIRLAAERFVAPAIWRRWMLRGGQDSTTA